MEGSGSSSSPPAGVRARTCELSPGRGAAIRKQQMVKYWTLLEIYSLHYSAPHLPPSHTTPDPTLGARQATI